MLNSFATYDPSTLLSGVSLRMRLLCFLLLLLLSAVSAGADSKAITTTLTTKWADTPLLLEARYNTAQLMQPFPCFTSDIKFWKQIINKSVSWGLVGSLLRLSSK